MGEWIDPHDASIDALIDWIGARRRRDPAAPLSDLLADHPVDQKRLIDIVCIDLMQRRRMKHAVTVENYLEEFPRLSSESNLLDLIDAELCVAAELGEGVDLENYAARFPALADQVRELFQLERGDAAGMTSAVVDLPPADMGQTVGPQSSAGAVDGESPSSLSGDFSIQVLPDESMPDRQLSSLAGHPIELPDWFVGDQCVASSPGRWLIRGRDSMRGSALALKVTELPALITAEQTKQILDTCEAAASVHHPSWVVPSVAAIQQRHLGVIRPWLFARPWQTAVAQDCRAQLRKLATVAFAIQAAHGRGATHGGIHLENLLIDHDGKVQILDGGSSRSGLQRWLNPAALPVGDRKSGQSFASLTQRKAVDSQDLIKLVAAASIEWGQQWTRDLVSDLRRIAGEAADDSCGRLGQAMMRYADSQPSRFDDPPVAAKRPGSWRKRLAHWLTGDP